MKKVQSELNDWLRPEYNRSDFEEITRGKYARRIRASTNVVVLDPQIAKVFPNDESALISGLTNRAERTLFEGNYSGRDKLRVSTRRSWLSAW